MALNSHMRCHAVCLLAVHLLYFSHCLEDDSASNRQPSVRRSTTNTEWAAGTGICNNISLLQILTKTSRRCELTDGLQNEFQQINNGIRRCEERALGLANSLKEEKHRRWRLTRRNRQLQSYVAGLEQQLGVIKDQWSRARMIAKDCADVQRAGYEYSGIYTVYPTGSATGVDVFCDLTSGSGGWLVIQRRRDGSQSFKKNWAEYRQGFGMLHGEFWLGNSNIHQISRQRHYELRVDMVDSSDQHFSASYDSFLVDDETNNFRLHLGQYSGNSGDSLAHHNHHEFSTVDNDHDLSRSGNCADLYGGGGWWWVRCYDSNLNGRYGDAQSQDAVVWFHLHSNHDPLKRVQMKIRPKGFAKNKVTSVLLDLPL